ncbi:AraC family transcriptional regulator [Domibacillus robiginosus]|uniref:AraC family transcriptional regulator n=1 Tax=Domibacillus robiginosus TaxID=1071054 RepID=UPI00067C6B88|nr:AraC family transcriptional regulator [Domibacillus robiginosus]
MNKELLNLLRTLTDEEQEILKGNTGIIKNLYINSSTKEIDYKRLLENGKLIQVRPHTRFVHFPAHTHNYVEVVYMCEGSTQHIINGNKVVLNQGELLFLNQNATQEIMAALENDIAVNFIVLPEFFDQPLKMIGDENNLIRDFIVSCLKTNNKQIGYLHFKVTGILPIQNLVENLIWTIMNDKQEMRSINQITMGLLFLQLMNHTDKVTSGGNYEHDMLLTVLRYIEENYREGELSVLAEIMQCDLLWLSRMIKRLTGNTYTEHVQKKRLSHASFLLNSTNLSIVDIGYAVGYENTSYFYRIFKEKYGQTPREYKLSQRDKNRSKK